MNKKCCVCAKNPQKGPDLSFRSFTTIPEKKRIWYSLLGFEENRKIPKGAMVCSDHFDPKDIYLLPNRKYPMIRRDADPVLGFPFDKSSSIRLPPDRNRRIKWLKACRRDIQDISPNSYALHVCEDHFNLEEDMDNYIRFRLMGGIKKMKAGVVPHIFDCQPDRKRASIQPDRIAALKRVRRQLVQEAVASISTATRRPLENQVFPIEGQKRNIWLSVINITSVPKTAKICSDHFDPKDYIVRRNGKKVLKTDATPKVVDFFLSHSPDRFPRDNEKRNIWLSIINMTDIIKTAKICSDHFNSDDYFVKQNGQKILKVDSTPKLIGHSVFSSDRFPDDTARRQIWISSLGVNDRNKLMFVCSDHFVESHFDCWEDNRKILRQSAVPFRRDAEAQPTTSQDGNSNGSSAANVNEEHSKPISEDDKTFMDIIKNEPVEEESPDNPALVTPEDIINEIDFEMQCDTIPESTVSFADTSNDKSAPNALSSANVTNTSQYNLRKPTQTIPTTINPDDMVLTHIISNPPVPPLAKMQKFTNHSSPSKPKNDEPMPNYTDMELGCSYTQPVRPLHNLVSKARPIRPRPINKNAPVGHLQLVPFESIHDIHELPSSSTMGTSTRTPIGSLHHGTVRNNVPTSAVRGASHVDDTTKTSTPVSMGPIKPGIAAALKNSILTKTECADENSETTPPGNSVPIASSSAPLGENPRLMSLLEEIASLQRQLLVHQVGETTGDPYCNRQFLISLLPMMSNMPPNINMEFRTEIMNLANLFADRLSKRM